MTASAISEPDTDFLELVRLADRITYGSNRDWLDIAQGAGYEGFLEWQLDDEAIDDSELEALLASFLPTLAMDADELADYVFEQENFGAARRDLILATLIRQVYSPRQLHERMVEFWSDHFNITAVSTIPSYFKALEDRETIRPLAMSSFGELLQASARSPAMLYYLDNFASTAEGPNENYARELLELHTLGVDGGYTEADIKDTARVLTGWTFREPAQFHFNVFTHDWEAKTVLGETFLPTGEPEGVELLDRLAGHESTARHLATKLARRFVADLPGAGVVDTVTETFLDSGGDIRTTLRALFMHPEVRTGMALKLKRPNDYAAGILRALDAELDEPVLLGLINTLTAAGHLPFTWPAPDGYPDDREHWQSTTGFLARFNSAAQWTSQLRDQSPALIEAAEHERLIDQIDALAAAFRPQGLSARELRALLRHGRALPPNERTTGLAAWMLAGADAQWR
jgi:uncharacterized protein (DUF1800 family)